MLVPEEFAQLLDELNRNELPYVLIGGVAVNLLGRERYTHDVDVLVPATQAQGAAIRRLLEGLQATRVDGSPDALRTGKTWRGSRSSMAYLRSTPQPMMGMGTSPSLFATLALLVATGA